MMKQMSSDSSDDKIKKPQIDVLDVDQSQEINNGPKLKLI